MSKYLIIPLLLISTFDFGAELFHKATSQNIRIDSTLFYKSINVSKAHKIIKENSTNSRLVIIDVRAEKNYNQDHIQNAINIDFKSSDFQDKICKLDKNMVYLVYCYGGYRSKQTMLLMKDKKFTLIYNMKGGMMKWKAKRLPVVSN